MISAKGRQDGPEQAGLGDLDVELLDLTGLDLLADLVDQAALLTADPGGHDLLAVVEGGPDLLVAVDEDDALDLAVLDVGDHLGGVDLLVAAVRGEVLEGNEHADHRDDDPHPGTSENALHVLYRGLGPRPPAHSHC
jgi:hypothetical protein